MLYEVSTKLYKASTKLYEVTTFKKKRTLLFEAYESLDFCVSPEWTAQCQNEYDNEVCVCASERATHYTKTSTDTYDVNTSAPKWGTGDERPMATRGAIFLV